MKRHRAIVLMIILVYGAFAGTANSQGVTAQTATVPTDKYAAFIVPDGGASLTLTIQATSGCTLVSSEIVPEDTGDITLWSPRSIASSLPHVYQSGFVLSSREWLHINGKLKRSGEGENGVSELEPFDVDVPSVDIDVAGLDDEDVEESVGAFLCVSNAMTTCVIRKVEPRSRFPSAAVLLEGGSGRLKIWRNANKTGLVTNSTSFAASELPATLWLEPVSASASVRDTELTVSYKCPNQCRTEDKVKLTVLKVESITPNMGLEIDDGDNNPKTRVFVVSVTNSGNVTVTADITPDIPEGSMPAGMTIHGGSGSGKLTRTVSRTTSSKTVFTFDCCGTDSGLRTTLYIYDAKIYLYADEGQRSWNTQFPYFTFNVGHSWWRLELSPETIEVLPFGLDYPFLNTNTGYWPMNPENLKPLTNYEDDGVVWFGDNGDGGHSSTGSHCWHIQFDKLISAIEWVQSRALNPGTYNLYNQNCTTETCEAGTHAGVSCDFITPWNFSDWLKQQ